MTDTSLLRAFADIDALQEENQGYRDTIEQLEEELVHCRAELDCYRDRDIEADTYSAHEVAAMVGRGETTVFDLAWNHPDWFTTPGGALTRHGERFVVFTSSGVRFTPEGVNYMVEAFG